MPLVALVEMLVFRLPPPQGACQEPEQGPEPYLDRVTNAGEHVADAVEHPEGCPQHDERGEDEQRGGGSWRLSEYRRSRVIGGVSTV